MYGFQCSQSSRGWWNRPERALRHARPRRFSALSRAVVGGTLSRSMAVRIKRGFSALSRAVVGGTCETGLRLLTCISSFSALSRAVVGGTKSSRLGLRSFRCFSALSRAVVGGTTRRRRVDHVEFMFQCSQSSRGWWNPNVPESAACQSSVSVLSVEPWLVEPFGAIKQIATTVLFQCSQSSRGWWN